MYKCFYAIYKHFLLTCRARKILPTSIHVENVAMMNRAIHNLVNGSDTGALAVEEMRDTTVLAF